MSALPPFLAIQAESHVKILSQLSDIIQIKILSQISDHPNITWHGPQACSLSASVDPAGFRVKISF